MHLSIPPTYPTDPPKAFFRTKIFHPNIEPETGAVCVETLKRDWKSTLTLRDVLVTISCLLVYPNASSALNPEAGMLLEGGGGEGWDGFEKRAKLMTRLQAAVPRELKDLAREAQRRGEADMAEEDQEKRIQKGKGRQEIERKDSGYEEVASTSDRTERPRRRRRGLLDSQEAHAPAPRTRRSARTPQLASTPLASVILPPPRPFVSQSATDDVFGSICLPHPTQQTHRTPQIQPSNDDAESDSELQDADQENQTSASLMASKPTLHPSPIRNGPSIPLGELSISDPVEETDDTEVDANESSAFLSDSMEAEYPPSPRKSPVKTQRRSSEDHYVEHPPSPRKESPRKGRALEYPPSPRKQSPAKSGAARRGFLFAPSSIPTSDIFAPSAASSSRLDLFSSRDTGAGGAGHFFTPHMNNQMHPALFSTQETPDVANMTEESEFEMSFEVLRQSERKKKHLLASPPRRKNRHRVRTRGVDFEPEAVEEETELEDSMLVGARQLRSRTITPARLEAPRSKRRQTPPASAATDYSIVTGMTITGKKSPRVEKSPRSAMKSSKTAEQKKKEDLEAKLWKLCGGNVDRWNRGDFGGDFMNIKASRW